MTGVHQPADGGTRIALGPTEIVIRLSADETGGAFSLCEYTTPAGGPSPPLHVHEETDEAFYVLGGELECTVGDEVVTAEPGATVLVPRGTAHTFSATGSDPARFLLLYLPGGFEGYFEEMGEFLESLPPGPPDMDALGRKAAELGETYDQTVVESERA